MKNFEFDPINQGQKPLRLVLENALIQSFESRRVEHKILSLFGGEDLRIPSQQFCIAHITVSDGIIEQNYTIQATGLMEDSAKVPPLPPTDGGCFHFWEPAEKHMEVAGGFFCVKCEALCGV